MRMEHVQGGRRRGTEVGRSRVIEVGSWGIFPLLPKRKATRLPVRGGAVQAHQGLPHEGLLGALAPKKAGSDPAEIQTGTVRHQFAAAASE